MMLKKLSLKFIVVFTAVLTCVFAAMVAAVQIVAGVYVGGNIRSDLDDLCGDVDAGVTEVVDEAAYLYARIVRRENAALLDVLGSGITEQSRSDALASLVDKAGVNSTYFVDVGWYDVNGFISLNGFQQPYAEVYAEAEVRKNSLVFGSYVAGCDTLAVYMNSADTETKGVFVFYMLESVLSGVYAAADPLSGYSFIMDESGYVLSHEYGTMSGKTLIYENLFSLDEGEYQYASMDGTAKFVLVRELTELNEHYGFGYYLIGVMDYNYYYGPFNTLTYIFVALASVIFVLGVILAVVRARRISRPVVQLNDSIGEVIRTGKRSAATAKEGDEIFQLEKNYDEMIDRIFKLMQKNKEDMEIQRKLELDTLQMQINPHFLYNTLDAVVWMAKIKKEHDIENLVLNLAMFFRLSLHKGDKFITIAEEIEICRHYMEIEKIRFRDKADISFDVDASVAKYKTLKLILQPLVENSMKYAFNERPGHISVRVRGAGDDVAIEVADDGAGFVVPEDILSIKHDGKSPGSGYGLYNVNERIKLEYGEGYGLTVTSAPGRGTKSVIRIRKKL